MDFRIDETKEDLDEDLDELPFGSSEAERISHGGSSFEAWTPSTNPPRGMQRLL